MVCPSCGGEVTEIFVRHEYDITYNQELQKWEKKEGEVSYSCSICTEEFDIRDIEDILKQVGEL